MLNEKQLMKIAGKEMENIFGLEYLRKNLPRAGMIHGLAFENTVYQLFLGIKGMNEFPNKDMSSVRNKVRVDINDKAHPVARTPIDKGWAVYGLVRIDAQTGDVIHKEYVLE